MLCCEFSRNDGDGEFYGLEEAVIFSNNLNDMAVELRKVRIKLITIVSKFRVSFRYATTRSAKKFTVPVLLLSLISKFRSQQLVCKRQVELLFE